MKTNLWSYLVQLFSEWKMFQTSVLQEIKTHILCPITSPPPPQKIVPFMICGKYGKATDDNTAHARCVDTQVYKHTQWICNTDCFSTTTMAARTRLSVTLFVLCLSVLFPHSHKNTTCGQEITLDNTWVPIFSTTTVQNISHSKKNPERYNHKCVDNFM